MAVEKKELPKERVEINDEAYREAIKGGTKMTGKDFNPILNIRVAGKWAVFIYRSVRPSPKYDKQVIYTVDFQKGTMEVLPPKNSPKDSPAILPEVGKPYDFSSTGMIAKALAGAQAGERWSIACVGSNVLEKGKFKGNDSWLHEMVKLGQ